MSQFELPPHIREVRLRVSNRIMMAFASLLFAGAFLSQVARFSLAGSLICLVIGIVLAAWGLALLGLIFRVLLGAVVVADSAISTLKDMLPPDAPEDAFSTWEELLERWKD